MTQSRTPLRSGLRQEVSAAGSDSLVAQADDSQFGAQEMAAARLAVEIDAALKAALADAGITQRELAGRLGVTEGAVSQVLAADGNLRVATIGRYLRALGLAAHVAVEPIVRRAQGDWIPNGLVHSQDLTSVMMWHSLNLSGGDVLVARTEVTQHKRGDFPSGAPAQPIPSLTVASPEVDALATLTASALLANRVRR